MLQALSNDILLIRKQTAVIKILSVDSKTWVAFL